MLCYCTFICQVFRECNQWQQRPLGVSPVTMEVKQPLGEEVNLTEVHFLLFDLDDWQHSRHVSFAKVAQLILKSLSPDILDTATFLKEDKAEERCALMGLYQRLDGPGSPSCPISPNTEQERDVSPAEVAEIRGMPGMHGPPMAVRRPTHTPGIVWEVRSPLCPSFNI